MTSNKKRSHFLQRKDVIRLGRTIFVLIVITVGVIELQSTLPEQDGYVLSAGSSPAATALAKLEVKGRAAKTGYKRELFSSGWGTIDGCDVRNYILNRDLTNSTHVSKKCTVATGTLHDPYTGKTIYFVRGPDTSSSVQIDHVVALGDAWQKGAQNLSAAERYALANDPLELLAVDGSANQNKGDSDAASWLPANKQYRCAYVARQIAVKIKYRLWVTQAEYTAMVHTLADCPTQAIPTALRQQNRSV